MQEDKLKKGRGAQLNTHNRFLSHSISKEEISGIDEWVEEDVKTVFLEDHSKSLVNKVTSPDVGMEYSMNPYQGCEHGCIYCYARNSFEYWGYSAGIDFESKIIVKRNAPALLRKFLMNPGWEAATINLSGNTDCYQPAEKRFGITRELLKVCREFNQPVAIITKNAGVLRDIDILTDLNSKNLTAVMVTITTQNESLRRKMEPRTTTAFQRFRVIEELSKRGIPTGIMIGPVIPGLNDHEIHDLIKTAADAGARTVGYTFVRLNGAIKLLFHDWLYKVFPDRAAKVWHMIESAHNGKVNDSEFGRRMRGEGVIADMVSMQIKKYRARYGLNQSIELDHTQFKRPGEQLLLF